MSQTFNQQLKKYYSIYTGGFVGFVVILGIAEQMGVPRLYIGYAFLAATILLYATIGIMSRTLDVAEYYVAGRKVPSMFNGMATGADWMSAASFIGMAGGLYLHRQHRLSVWLVASTYKASTVWPSSWVGRAATVWWHCS